MPRLGEQQRQVPSLRREALQASRAVPATQEADGTGWECERGGWAGEVCGVTRPRILDLFCGAGGAAVGYHSAGFDVVGVDVKPQPRYPFEFHQAAMEHVAVDLARESPPRYVRAIPRPGGWFAVQMVWRRA